MAGKSPILPPTAALDLAVAANVSPSPLSGTALEQANTVSIEEAGVGPMAPLVAAAAAVQAAAQAASKEERLASPNLGGSRPPEKKEVVVDEEDNHSGCQLSPRGGSEGEGEETETAPEGENEDDDDEEDDDDVDEEAEEVNEADTLNESLNKASKDQDDSITRCICDFLHDDGYMICCDKCL